MQFVRGESTDSESKGERYTWGASRPGGRGPRGLPAREPSTGGAARRGGAEHDADDSYWDDDEEDHTPAQAAGVDPDNPLEAYMASLQGRHDGSMLGVCCKDKKVKNEFFKKSETETFFGGKEN